MTFCRAVVNSLKDHKHPETLPQQKGVVRLDDGPRLSATEGGAKRRYQETQAHNPKRSTQRKHTRLHRHRREDSGGKSSEPAQEDRTQTGKAGQGKISGARGEWGPNSASFLDFQGLKNGFRTGSDGRF